MLPRVVIHNAVSADGRIDWFEADVGVLYDLAGRWHEECTLVGSGTVLAAPESAARDKGPWEPQVALPTDTRPLLAIVDSRGRVRCWKTWLAMPYWRGGVAICSDSTPDEYLQYLAEAGEKSGLKVSDLLSVMGLQMNHDSLVYMLEEILGGQDFAGWFRCFRNISVVSHLKPSAEFIIHSVTFTETTI
jgi:hypothetical protein